MTRHHSAIAQEYLDLRAKLLLDYPDLRDDVEALADTLDGISDLPETVGRFVRASREDAAMATALGGIMDEMAERRRRIEARAEQRREIARRLMEAVERNKIELPDLTISLRPAPQKVQETDPTLIPDAYWVTKRSLDKAALKATLLAGVDVPGATLSNGGVTLQVRSR